MKGFELIVNKRKTSGGVTMGITGISLTYRDNACRVLFSSMDETGMFSQTWYSSELSLGDRIMISYQEIDNPSPPERIIDYHDKELVDKLTLEGYYRMRDELIKEGLITNEG